MIDTNAFIDCGYVPGDGPEHASLFMVGEAPAATEIKTGRVFTGQAGQFLDFICRKAGLPPRDLIYITNIIKVPAIDNEDERITEGQIKEWEWMLHAELEEHKPKVVASLGSWATRWFLRNYSPGYPHTNDLDWLHGVPRVGTAPWGSFLLVPCYHPAAGLHDSDSIPKIYADLQALQEVWYGKRGVKKDKQQRVYFEAKSLGNVFSAPELASDTEGYPGDVWMMSYSIRPGEGWVIKSKELMQKFIMGLQEYKGQFILHNAPHDLRVYESLGLDLYHTQFSLLDTMQVAKYLNTETGSLKGLAYRHLGLEMSEYMDIMRPIQNKFAFEYLTMINTIDYGKPDPNLEWKNGSLKVGKPWGLNRRINAILKDALSNPSEDIVARWKMVLPYIRRQGEEVFGKMPSATLLDADPTVATNYSGQDADATLCVKYELERLMEVKYGKSSEAVDI